MRLIIEAPTVMRIEDCSRTDFNRLKESLTYKNTSVAYQIKMTKEMAYRYGEVWAAGRLEELEKDLYETLIFADDKGYYTRPGLLRYIQKRFVDVTVSNIIDYPEFKLIPWNKEPENTPYPYQTEAVERMVEAKHAHIEFSTGIGKSFIIELLAKRTGLPTVISTPSKSIAKQIYEEMKLHFGKQKVGFFGDGKDEIGKHILVAIGKSLSLVKEPEEKARFKKYQVFISDESHTTGADQFEYYVHNVLEHCPYRWFMSGTQERSDGSELKLLSIIGPQVMTYSIQKGIAEGYLAKLSFMVFNVPSPSYYSSNNLVKMNQEHLYKNERIAQIISLLSEQAVLNNMPTLILIDEHIQEQILRSYMKVDFEYASGKSDIHNICNRFNSGDIMCVVGTSAASTGTNFKPVRLTINWQANKSSVKVKQGPIGRSTRIDKRTNKKDCKIVDFRVINIDALKRHSNERIKYYNEIVSSYTPQEKIEYVNYDELIGKT